MGLKQTRYVQPGTIGSVSVFVTGTTELVLDIDGYFVNPAGNSQSLGFYPVAPCRVVDTRNPAGPLGGPIIGAAQSRNFPVLTSSCGSAGQRPGLLFECDGCAFRTAWVSDAVAVRAGAAFGFDAECAYRWSGGQRGEFGGPVLAAAQVRSYRLPLAGCGIPGAAAAYSLNATVVPAAPLGYLTLWPAGIVQPPVSTLNAVGGAIVANAAVVPAGTEGAVASYATSQTHLILDGNGYFAP